MKKCSREGAEGALSMQQDAFQTLKASSFEHERRGFQNVGLC